MLVILALILAILAASVVFTITGVIQPQQALIRMAGTTSWLAPHVDTYMYGREYEVLFTSKQEELDQAWAALAQTEQEQARELDRLQDWEARLRRQSELIEKNQADAANVQRLAELYTEMQPAEAVRILQLLDEELLFKVLVSMDSQTASEILATLPPELAASLSSRFK